MRNLPKVCAKENKLCTGCGACMNVCPVNAITMQTDREGFAYPEVQEERCIDCGLCEKQCPVLHPEFSNMDQPECYAMMAQDEERQTSSSGGFVPVVARWVLRQGGSVFGAAWDANWNVRHIEITNETELYKIKGSKYLQGRAERSYQLVKRKLEEGKWVLFTGLPCQVAGLYGVLGGGKKREKLITIDILCHGAPSYKVFRKYLEENYELGMLERLEFRNKSVFGWSTGISCYYKNGVEIHKRHQEDKFYQAFLPCMIMRPSCEQCAFSRIPRQGDFTAGDFWGVEKTEPKWEDRLGTSAVLVNNKKAKRILRTLTSQMKLLEPVSLEAITYINKTVEHPFKSHSGRKHFFYSMDIKPFNELTDYALEHKYDIGIVGLWYGINYGSILTYYALYQVVRILGYDAVMLPKPNILWDEHFNDPATIGQVFIWKYCNVFLPYPHQYAYCLANDACKDFLVGSDVVWNYEICGKESDMFFYLDWVESGHKKIAYAASPGNDMAGPDTYELSMSYYLKKFDAISIREQKAVEAAQKRTARIDIANVLDSVFLCPIQIYEDLVQHIRVEDKGSFVFAYILRNDYSEENMRLIEIISNYYNAVSCISANPMEHGIMRQVYGDRIMPVLSVEEWIWYMRNTVFYFGDSYHGLCFSLIFHKPFIIVYRATGDPNIANERFKSLLRIVGLEERLLEDVSIDRYKVEELIKKPVDWETVDKKLNRQRDFSFEWLKSALKSRSKKKYTAEDIIRDRTQRKTWALYDELTRKNDMLFQEINEIKKQITEQRNQNMRKKR